MMSLIESYQVGKSEYHRLLNTLIDAMGNYKSTEIKDALLEISKDSDNPHHIRIKALNALKELADQNVVDEMLLSLSLINVHDEKLWLKFDNLIFLRRLPNTFAPKQLISL